MTAKLPFDPDDYPPAVVRLIVAKSESANCSPSEALRLLLNEMAAQAGFSVEPPPSRRSGPLPESRQRGEESATR